MQPSKSLKIHLIAVLDRASFAPPFGSVEKRGHNTLPKGTWGLLREERPLVELRPGRHTVMSNTLPLLASSWALPLSARNVFARITKGRGDTRPCLWTSGALSKSGGLPLCK